MAFTISASQFPKSDPRYKKWLKSLKKRPPVWSKGKTKADHPSIAKISRTFKEKKIDNFAGWRKEMILMGKIKTYYPPIQESGDLAELIGVVLGDGHIEKYPRTERLSIFSNKKNRGFIKRYALLVKGIFNKEASVLRHGNGCMNIGIYEKNISLRLKIPTGARGKLNIEIPNWIKSNTEYLRRYLRGLYEAEGCFSTHKPTYTYKFLFANRNESLLNNVFEGMCILGFHPHRSKNQVQISKKSEVYKAQEVLEFRKYK